MTETVLRERFLARVWSRASFKDPTSGGYTLIYTEDCCYACGAVVPCEHAEQIP